jgi:peptidoglycan/LPS O-acetylase OafA/YrhL
MLICSGERRFSRAALILAAVWAVGACIALSPENAEAFPGGWLRVAAFGAPSALIVYGAVSLEMQGRLKPPGWLVIIGDWSYALYLSHLLVLSGLVRVWVSVLPDFGPMASLAFLIVSVVLCIAVAGAGFRLLEFPALKATRRLGDRLFNGPHRPRGAPAAHEDPAVQAGQAGSRDG